MDLEIKGFIETSFLDWDGKVVATLFLPYCNFRCPFCHNAGLIEKPQDFETVPLARIERFLEQRKDFIDGVCLTGGEPCLHKERGLFDLMRRLKKKGFAVKLDTNGADPKCLEAVIDQQLVDYIAMDIKGPLDERYDKLSGIKTDLGNIKQSIKLIKASGLPYEFRTTLVPTLLDMADVRAIAESLAGAQKFVLQQFVAENSWDETLRELRPYQEAEIKEMLKEVKRFVPNAIVRGV
jgi:pyruvate formate lyase activating enzyme